MTDVNSKRVLELLRKPGNNQCVDCSHAGVEYASYNIGVFLCTQCAGIHRGLGAHVSKVKHLKLDRWEDSQVKRLEEVGNTAAKRKFEERVPACYRRPTYKDPQVLREQWIQAKYLREEFIYPERQVYTRGTMEGYLMKRGKVGEQCKPRRFVLSETDNTLKYYVKEKKDCKAEIKILDLNVAFAPEKINTPTSLQLSFLHHGSTRHIFVYHEDAETIVNWYQAIRSAKLNLLHVAHPLMTEAELAQNLTQDFLKEGYLLKTGPRPSDAYRKRWFTLDGRKLMYHEEPLDPYPKGEIFLGYMSDGFSVTVGFPDGWKARETGFPFTVRTPTRTFLMSAESSEDRTEWIRVIQQVMQRPLTAQDAYCMSGMKQGRKSNLFR